MRRLALAVLLTLTLASDARAAGAGSTFLIGRPAGFGALPDDSVNRAGADAEAVSDDGRFVVFVSDSDGLLPAGADRRFQHVFVRDRVTTTTLLVSTSASGTAGNNDSFGASISGDGTKVGFVSAATNLTGDALPAGGSQAFVKDLASGAVSLASVDSAGAPSPGFARVVRLDSSGEHAAFQTNAALVTDDDNGADDVYVRDFDAVTTTLVSRDTTATGDLEDDPSEEPVISAGGDSVAFTTINDYDDDDDNNGDDDVYVRNLPAATTVLVSRFDGTGLAAGDAGSEHPSISGDGTRIAFTSKATDLIGAGGDTNGVADIYVRTLSADDTDLASRPDGTSTGQGTEDALAPAISADGTQVAFATASALVGGVSPPPGGSLAYVRTLGTTVTRLASRATGAGGAPADTLGAPLSLTAAGDQVIFAGGAGNFGGPDVAAPGVYARNLTGATTDLVSGPTGTANPAALVDDGDGPAISADGRFVAFQSRADGLSGEDDDRVWNVYLRDTLTGALTVVSRGPFGPADGDSIAPAIAADGSRIAFRTEATNLGGAPGIWAYDRATGALAPVSRQNGADGGAVPALDFGGPRISGDGARVAFMTEAAVDAAHDANGKEDVYVRDLAAGTTTLASRATGPDTAAGNGRSFLGALDRTGNRVAFYTESSDLGDGDTTPAFDVHVRDLDAQSTVLASRPTGPGTPPGNERSTRPSISADGQLVVFESSATDLGGLLPEGADQIYLRDLAAATTTLLSREGVSGPAGTAASYGPLISADGSTVAFGSVADNLVGTGDVEDDQQVVVRTLATAAIEVASRADGADGASTHDTVNAYDLTADGGCVTFATAGLTSGYPSPDYRHVYMRVLKGECPPAPAASPSPSPSPEPAVDRVKPVLSKVSLTRKRFRVGPRRTAVSAAKRGTTLRYTLSETARVRIAILRQVRGKRQGRRCVKPTRRLRKAKRCTRLIAAGTLTRAGAAGANRVAFSGRVGKRKLKRGRHRLAVRATDAAGNRSAPKTLRFRIVRR